MICLRIIRAGERMVRKRSGAFSKLLPWSIAKGQLGDPLKWDIIYQRNSGSVKNPDLIYEGKILDIPKG